MVIVSITKVHTYLITVTYEHLDYFDDIIWHRNIVIKMQENPLIQNQSSYGGHVPENITYIRTALYSIILVASTINTFWAKKYSIARIIVQYLNLVLTN